MATWDTAYINNLPDSAFACIEAGGTKDSSGKTVPRDLRYLPHHDSSGAVDLPHLRNALSREPQADLSAANHAKAHAHLEAHAAAEGVGTRADEEEAELETLEPRTIFEPALIEIRDAARREVDFRLLPWGQQIDTALGPEEFQRGAFDDAIADRVYLYGPEHQITMGLGQRGEPRAVRVPIGRATAISNEPDGPHATFRVARTAAGDEALALMADRIIPGVSIEFSQVPGGTRHEIRGGRRVRVHTRAALLGATPTHRPAYGDQAAVLAVRSQHEEDAPVGESTTPAQEAPAPLATIDPQALAQAFGASVGAEFRSAMEGFEQRLVQMEETVRKDIKVPAGPAPTPQAPKGEWMSYAIRALAGERVADAEYRALSDLITSENIGVVPPAYSTELIGIIDTSRPFLGSTRRLNLPPAGMTLNVPKIVTRATAGKQTSEKGDVASQDTSITSVGYDAQTIAGGGDISLQLLKRSSPSYLDLYLELLAEAVSANAETSALTSLLDLWGDVGGVNDGGNLNPENLILGPAWEAGAAVRQRVDTMWLSSAAVAAFIDAKASTTNAPLYSSIQAGFTAGNSPSGSISGLRPVWVPALDATACDVLVGPSRGFGWTEDGSYTLQVDVPAKAGRDVALVTILWFAPLYPTAFTAYGLTFS